MRILLIVHHRRWRAAYRSRVIAGELARRGHQITLMVTADKERWRFQDTVEADGVRVIHSPDLTWGRLRSGWDPVLRCPSCVMVVAERVDPRSIYQFETRPATILPWLVVGWRSGPTSVIDRIDRWGRGGIISIASS